MTSIASSFIQTAMRRSLLGAHGQDPVVPDPAGPRAGGSEPSTLGAHDAADAPLRIGRYDDGLATLRDARSRRRIGSFGDGLARIRGSSGGLGEALVAACRERGATRLAVPAEAPASTAC
jgi:hypothetical protein